MSQYFDDPKVRIEITNGFDYLKEHREEFDVIIVDSSDPDGSLKERQKRKNL